MGEVVSLDEYNAEARRSGTPSPGHGMDVFFDRRELSQLLNLYGTMVARGEWRDYAIGHDRECCTFAVFERTSEAPLFRISKRPKLARKQGAFQVQSRDGRIARRGHTLEAVLRVFERKLWQVVEN
ncbi:MAG: DUF2794 domain-containing protein [Pseudomonadota bacterium]|nr:DUF2794 domain-containing protein [Pseudomonadota bacterium]